MIARDSQSRPPRRLLMIANPFPPLASGGNARQVRFARFLPECGWEVTVLTVRTPGPAPVPDGLRIERASAPGPDSAYRTARRARRLLGRGGARTPRVAPREVAGPRPLATDAGAPSPGPSRRFSRRGVLGDWLFVPDEWVGWIGPAVRLGRQLLRTERYDAIMSSFPRPSAELVASILARETGLPWLADYRDPWATRHLRRYPTPMHRRAHYSLESWALRAAAAVTTTAEPIAATLRRRFPPLADRVSVLPNGFDPLEEEAPAPMLGDGLWLVHTGRLYGRSEQLRRTLVGFAALPADVKLLFIGIEGRDIRRLAADLGVTDRIRTLPFVPHGEALAYQRAADGLLLITGNAPEALSSKVFEYLAAGRPIFAYVPEGSAAHELLTRTGGAVIGLQSASPDAPLHRFVEEVRAGTIPAPDPAVVAGYDGRTLTRRLATILDGLADRRPHRVPGAAAAAPTGGPDMEGSGVP